MHVKNNFFVTIVVFFSLLLLTCHPHFVLLSGRYAGLIEVADGISEMKTSVEGVTSSISDLQKTCHQLKKRQATKIPGNDTETAAVADR